MPVPEGVPPGDKLESASPVAYDADALRGRKRAEPMTVSEFYMRSIRPLPPDDRLRLAALILNDLSPPSPVDVSEGWSEEDLGDFAQASWRHIDEAADEQSSR